MDADSEPQVLGEAPHEIRHQYLSAAKARRMLDWQPLFSLEQGLQQTIDWYKHFMEQESCPISKMSAALVAKSA
jgi:CDP-glucose 4,6-dehydratase